MADGPFSLGYLPLILAATLSVLSYLSVDVIGRLERIHSVLASLSAGILVSIIFVSLLPIFSRAAIKIDLYIVLLVGFVAFNLLEKFTYQRAAEKDLKSRLSVEQFVGFAIDHLVIGLSLVLVFLLDSVRALLVITVPFLIHIFATAHPISHVWRGARLGVGAEVALSLMPFAGAVLATLLAGFVSNLYAAFAFVLGALMFLVIRDVVPKEREGKPAVFAAAALATVLVLVYLGLT